MAQKRMFSKDVVRTDRFLDMPLSAQALYFHLSLDADVKGFVEPGFVMRLTRAQPDDLNVLIAKQFIIPFESGVLVVTHWHLHNQLREDRESPSQFVKELKLLQITSSKTYEITPKNRALITSSNSGSTPGVLRRSIDKISIDKINTPLPPKGDGLSKKLLTKADGEELISLFNGEFSRKFRLTDDVLRKIQARGKTYQKDELALAIKNAAKVPFNQGDNDRGWSASPEWLFRNDATIDKYLNATVKEKEYYAKATDGTIFWTTDQAEEAVNSGRYRYEKTHSGFIFNPVI